MALSPAELNVYPPEDQTSGVNIFILNIPSSL